VGGLAVCVAIGAVVFCTVSSLGIAGAKGDSGGANGIVLEAAVVG